MLRLNPGDNQGQRTWTGPLLLKANRPADALSFLQHWLEPAAREGKIVPRGGCDFEAPSKEPLSAGVIESLGKHVEGTFVYTAALAAFKLWGPCELAEQYLTIATELNPAVLLKVLGKIARPSEFSLSTCTKRVIFADQACTSPLPFPCWNRDVEYVRAAIK